MKSFCYFIIRLLFLIIYALSHLAIRKKNRWAFGEPHGFNNNSKYFFLEVLEKHPEIEAKWIGSKKIAKELTAKGIPAYWRYSMAGIYYTLTSKVFVVSWTTGDINFYLSGGAIIVNLWHGIPLKKCLWLDTLVTNKERKGWLGRIIDIIESPIAYLGCLYVNSPSAYFTPFFMKMFRVENNHVIEDIYPRNKFMMKSKDEILYFLKKYKYFDELNFIKCIAKFSKVLLYAPTFRDNGKDFVESSGINFIELNKQLMIYNTCLIVKFHPATKYDGTRFKDLSNVLFLNNKFDLYPIMPFTDLLISDYSSILYDYMLLNKKMLAFTFDYKQYVSECRELLFDIREGLDGIPIVNNARELENLIFTNTEKLPDASPILYEKCWKPSENLIERIFRMCNIS